MLFILVAALVAGVWAQDCGVKPDQDPFTDYIVGGRNATPGNWPWQLSLQIADQGAFRHTCGASVLTTDWALTAAHCVHNRGGPEDFRVVAGAHNIKELSGSEQIIYIDMIIKHENYSQISLLGFPNDICLLRLSTPLDLSVTGVGPACLAQPDMGDFASHPDCWISGWGLTHWTNTEVPAVLQEALVPVPTNAACSKTFVMLRDSHVCSGDGRPSACMGDSGGPMTCKVDDTWYVVGVASFGVVFCQGVPMVYTRVSSYVDWVDDTMTANARP